MTITPEDRQYVARHVAELAEKVEAEATELVEPTCRRLLCGLVATRLLARAANDPRTALAHLPENYSDLIGQEAN
jgi:hypothetical protein